MQDCGWELSAVTLPQPKVDPMGYGSDGGVPPAPSQPVPPENQTPKGAEMCFPRELRSLWWLMQEGGCPDASCI